jgi:hypothetical protein
MRARDTALCIGTVVVVLTGCGGGGGGDDPAPSPPVAAPTVDLASNVTSARVGDTVTLTWTTQGATSCTASGNWTGARSTSGSDTIKLTDIGSANFILTCNGAGGASSDTATLPTAAAMQQLTIPGAPTPINFAKGACVPTETGDFSVKCVTTAGEISTKYDSFSSDVSGRVQFTATTQPVTTLGGACVGGFDRVQSRLSVDTTLVDHVLPITGSTITEIVYKPAFLSSISQGALSQMSALMFQDNSNTDRMGIVLAATVSGDPLIIASGGTISSAGSIDLVQCISAEQVTTPPVTPPTTPNLTCPAGTGAGQNGLEFSGATSFSIASTGAGQTTPRSMGWGVRYNNPNRTADSFTGSLRVTLWAVPSSFTGGTISGYKLFTGFPNFVGAGARSANQIYNFYTFSNIESSGTGANPVAGNYCIVAALDQFSSTCTSNDGYCYADWVQFDGAERFQ